MNMTQEKWQALPEHEKAKLRSDGGLTPQLKGLEGWRVEVVDCYGERRRFIVGRSTGWSPCHIEVARRDSTGGPAVMGTPFKSVRGLYRARGC